MFNDETLSTEEKSRLIVYTSLVENGLSMDERQDMTRLIQKWIDGQDWSEEPPAR